MPTADKEKRKKDYLSDKLCGTMVGVILIKN